MGSPFPKNPQLRATTSVQPGGDPSVNSRIDKEIVGRVANQLIGSFYEADQRIRPEWKVLKVGVYLNDWLMAWYV